MDPLDWTHQWDDFEMMMYALSGEESGVFMQVSKHEMQDGAEEWLMLYDRKIADLPEGIEGEPGTPEWEERVLRTHLNANPQLVNTEKAFLQEYLQNNSGNID